MASWMKFDSNYRICFCFSIELIIKIYHYNLFYSMTETLPIDMDILRNKIVEGLTYIQKNANEKQAVLFIGDTGVGKSTLLSYLIGEQLKIQEVGLKPCLVSCNTSKNNSLKIGHQKYSETSVPVRVQYGGQAFYDCPGFNDNKSQQAQIANSFYYQRLMSLYEKTKLVIVIDQSYITQTRAHRLPSLAKKFQAAFGSLAQVRYSTLLIVNKCGPDSTLEDVKKQLKKLITTKDMFSQQQVQYFDYLIRSQEVYSFKQPRRSQIGEFADESDRNQILTKIKELDYMDKVDIKNIISDIAKLSIRDYLDVITQNSAQKLELLIDKMKTNIFNVKANLYQIKEQIISLFKYKQHMQERRDLRPLFDFFVQRKLQCQEIDKFRQELQVVQFFSKVYSKQKTESYYLNTVSLILTNFSMMLHKIDTMIQEEKLQAERKKRKQQRRLQMKRLDQIEKDKQNSVASTIAKITKNNVNTKPGLTQVQQNKKVNIENDIKIQKVGSIQYVQQKIGEPAILAFHRKLMNAQLRVKQISYGITDLHSKASSFQESFNKYQK